MTLNWTIIIISALVPTVTGMIWYNPKVFGTVWMTLSGLSEEKMKQGSMAKMVISSILLSFLIALTLNPMVIHQMGILSTLMGEPGFLDQATGQVSTTTEPGTLYNSFMATYGDRFRTFKHGAFHGIIYGIMLIFPILAINGIFERKPFKLTLIHSGYWIVTLALMGGLICQFK